MATRIRPADWFHGLDLTSWVLTMEEWAILDGYTIECVIPRVPGLHPRIKLKFRPALADERHAWLMGTERDVDGKARNKRVTDILKRHLESWDVRTRDGKEAGCRDDATLAKLQPALQSKLLDLVLGYAPAQEEADAGNSPPASS
jgi:hypothetical protein